ncbi:hypothetical protein L873DRAFT_1793711 [Choiromyces venosus 120613-1]|uniref:Uncharacterized protein n=1 Tax=Choiromyces venosus 120613-1 TaxID=1336337 RepID=A0A3N4J7L0_9PEZI|nr:hypothetical protein L873DRAFT_1793711 [Choiromyces venosus 120613-1]
MKDCDLDGVHDEDTGLEYGEEDSADDSEGGAYELQNHKEEASSQGKNRAQEEGDMDLQPSGKRGRATRSMATLKRVRLSLPDHSCATSNMGPEDPQPLPMLASYHVAIVTQPLQVIPGMDTTITAVNNDFLQEIHNTLSTEDR